MGGGGKTRALEHIKPPPFNILTLIPVAISLYRIKQCVDITHNQLVTLHHELGHIQYFLQYWNLSAVYRTGVNPGFHEAVGDLMSLSVDTTTHLQKLGLLENYTSDEGGLIVS